MEREKEGGRMKVIDLSHPIREGMQIFPGDPAPSVEKGLVHEADYCHVDRLMLGSHTGTHIDAPYHFLETGAKIDEFDVSRFVGRGLIVDVTSKDAGEAIAENDLLPYWSRIKDGDFVLFHTGWDRYFGQERYLDHPYLTPDCARAFVALGVTLIGVDFLNVDPTKQEIFPVHDILLSRDVLIVENITNLDKIKTDTAWFSFLPLKILSDGSPVRAVAMEME